MPETLAGTTATASAATAARYRTMNDQVGPNQVPRGRQRALVNKTGTSRSRTNNSHPEKQPTSRRRQKVRSRLRSRAAPPTTGRDERCWQNRCDNHQLE